MVLYKFCIIIIIIIIRNAPRYGDGIGV